MDAVVIGGGLGGLAAGLTLAARGREVVLVEAAPQLGGKAGHVTVDGVTFDTGPSVFTLPAVADALFRDAGSSLDDALTLRPVDTARMRFPDAVVDLGHGLEATLDGIGDALGAGARRQAAAYLAYAQQVWDAVAPVFVLGPAPSPATVLARGPRAIPELWRADPMRSMRRAIRSHVDDPRLAAIFERFATYNGSDPRVAPATLNCIAWVELGIGAFGIEGGLQALVDALVQHARRHGLQIRAAAPAASIEAGRDGVRAVVLADGERIGTRAVVCNADARHLTETLLPGSVRAASTSSTSGWTAVLRDRRRADRPAHEVVFHMPYEDEFIDLFDNRCAPSEPTVYVCAQEPAHGRRGWDEDEPLFVMINAPAGCEDVEASAARALARLRETGVIGRDATPVWARTPAQLAARFAGSDGALYGAASNSRVAAFLRPANRSRVPGLYLASGTAHPGGGVPMVLQSGREAARCLLEDQP